ncbi:MAG: ABC transporter ATP-binding protein [Candidatus Actinomarina sp.]|nr:ABC transporter ATP-binding protein [Actinomycetota bacterium]
MINAVEASNVTRKYFKRGKKDKIALDDVSLNIPKGSFYGLLGPNGAGKSTLIRIFSTLLLPSEGKVSVLGYDVKTQASEIRWKISLVAGGEMSGYGLLTVYEQLWMFAMFNGLTNKEAKNNINSLLEIVGLNESKNTKLSELSTGMRQKMNLVRGLMSNPEVLFLDEPTLGLDVEIARDVRNYLKIWMKEGNGNRTVLLTTHYMQEAEDLCDTISIIDEGKILHTGTADFLKDKSNFDFKYIVKFSKDIEAGFKVDNLKFEYIDLKTIEVYIEDSKKNEEIFNKLKDLSNVISISLHRPNLEDTFLALTGKQLNEKI